MKTKQPNLTFYGLSDLVPSNLRCFQIVRFPRCLAMRVSAIEADSLAEIHWRNGGCEAELSRKVVLEPESVLRSVDGLPSRF